jgi:hypothetical protein
MATRAERFKAETARAKPKKAPKATRAPSPAKLMEAAAPPEDRRYGAQSTGARNRSLGHKATAALEDSLAPGRPSRKSTRKSSHHQKAASTLTAREQLRVASPGRRHLTRS